ncbi:MAG: hypothetical protein KAJ19_09535, partial [Gammaproteobacteria bacterium]|nr:hypothetical protein [Gammaproteobacteria bacterium]
APPDVLWVHYDMVATLVEWGHIIKLGPFVPECSGEYQYHHGCYDSDKREFRGFGRVDLFMYGGYLYGIPLGAEWEFALNAYAISTPSTKGGISTMSAKAKTSDVSTKADLAFDLIIFLRTKTPPPSPPPDERSFTGSVPLPSEVSTDPEVIGTNALFALIFVLITYFAATLFNSTIRDNYETIQGWLGFIGRPISNVISRLPSIEMRVSRYLKVLGSVAIFALIYSFLDPYFTNGIGGLALFISLALAIGIVTYTYEGIQVLVSGHPFRIPAGVKILPIGIVVAVVFVIFSRAIDFHPGLIYGFIGAYASLSAVRRLSERQQAITILLGALFLIVIAFCAFFLRMLIADPASAGGNFWLSLADGILVGVFVIGLEGLLFTLVPLTFMDGAKVTAWKRWVWLVVFALVAFLFYHVIINEHGGLAEAAGDMEVVMMFGLMGFFLMLSGVTWLYFQWRQKPPSAKRQKSKS